MAKFNEKVGIVLEPGDLEHETPYWVKNFFEFITGKPSFESTLPKPNKVNLVN